MKKRFAIILAIAMMFTSLPLYAFAADETSTQTDQTQQETVVQNGWDENKTVYYENGSKLTNIVKKIDGKLYYFNGSGKVTTKKNAWLKLDGKKYWFNEKRNLVTKPTYIKNSKGKKVLYMFTKEGKLLVKKKGLFKYGGKEYYSLGKGKLKTGWVAVKKQAMYFNKKNDKKTGTLGSMAKNTKIGYLKVPKNGRLGEAYALGVKQLNKSGWTLRKAYTFSYRLRYKDRWYRQKSAEKYALRGFKKGYGNCYVMASTFYIQAKLLGYDVHQVKGKVGIWPHSWTVIKQDGRNYVYDPNFRNETGRNGWKIWYGKKGTWRYSRYSYMN